MCRLYAFRANEPTKVECSLVHAQNALLKQDPVADARRRHVDGWGIVCYENQEPAINRRANAAFGGTHFNEAAANIYSNTVVAHVRTSTVGCNSPLNRHPFTHDRWSFAHNGTIPSFETVGPKMEQRIATRFMDCRLGSTDSELMFLWLLSALADHDLDENSVDEYPEESMQAVAIAIAKLSNLCREEAPHDVERLNFVLTNGPSLFACRWNNSLYKTIRDGVCDCEVCGAPHIHHDPTIDYRAVIVASEPISHKPWTEVDNYSLTLVTPSLTCNSRLLAESTETLS